MDRHRPFRAAVVKRSLIAAVAAAGVFLAFRQRVNAEAVIAGSAVGLFSFFHIAKSFYRLTQRPQTSLMLLIVESLARVFVAGVVPVLLFRHGPLWAYFIYLAAFVAPLAVAAAWMRQEFKRELVCAAGDSSS